MLLLLQQPEGSLLIEFRHRHIHIHLLCFGIIHVLDFVKYIFMFESIVCALPTVKVICLLALNPHFHPSLLYFTL